MDILVILAPLKKGLYEGGEKNELRQFISDVLENWNDPIPKEKKSTVIFESGIVTQVGDGIARVRGIKRVMVGEMVEILTALPPTGASPGAKEPLQDLELGIALNLEENYVGIVLLGQGTEVKEGCTVLTTGEIAQVPVGYQFLGKVIDGLSRPIDGIGMERISSEGSAQEEHEMATQRVLNKN